MHSRFRRALLCASLAIMAGASLASAQQIDSALFAGLQWRMIGPFRGGRTVASTGVRGQPNVFYVAATDGGVWKSTDYGRVWTPIFDQEPMGSIGAIAVAPSDPNIIYVGSGEGLQRPDLSIGDGLYKSTDAGRTWSHLAGLRDGEQTASIIVDPHDPNRLFVAVLGHPYGPNAERGVYRSTDGGATFDKVLYKDENTGAVALRFDPSNAQTIYAVLWEARQGPWEYDNAYAGPGSGLYKSVDGGATWRQLGGGLPTFAQGLGRIGIAVAPSDSRRLYAMVQAPPKVGGVYRSDDAGETWTRTNGEERVYGRGDDFAEVEVDPTNADEIYVANTSAYRSTDGGHTFTAFKGAPGGDDYHRIWINPDNPKIILIGVDQGATITVNGGATWSSWYNQPTAQMFHVAADNRFPYRVYGGQQESGSVGISSRGADGAITFRDWHPVGVEEYGYAVPDPLHPGIIYGGKVTRYDERTGQVKDVGPIVLRSGAYRFDRTAPIIFSPADPHVLYFAAQVLFKTTNGGRTWTTISPDLTRPDAGVPPSLGVFAQRAGASPHRGVIYSIAPSPRDVQRIWIGTDDGLIQTTRDGGAHWRNVTPNGMEAWTKITQLDASHFDTASAYASASRLRVDDLRPYIYRTHDGGKTWQTITSGIPDDEPVNVVREDPVRRGLLYAGTEHAVYVSFDDGAHWQSLRLGMPVTSIRDLIVHDNDLVIATHGRSFWVLDDIAPLRQASAHIAQSPAFLFAPAPAYRVRRDANTDTPLPPEEPAAKNPPDGAIVDYWIGAGASPNDVTLEVRDAHGALVRRFSSADTAPAPDSELNVPTYWVKPFEPLRPDAGMHRFVWDLHYPPPDALEHDYPISAIPHDTPRDPLGPSVEPGRYTVQLRVGTSTFTEPLEVRMDPRVRVTRTALDHQLALARQLTSAMHRDFVALSQIRTLRRQLSQERIGSADNTTSAAGQADALDSSLAVLVGDRRAGRQLLNGDNLTQLDGDLLAVLNVVEGADGEPTTRAAAAVSQLDHRLDAVLARWRRVEKK
ncbi:MAG: WD40/YVTN/BNR-like repeat-containing protein [Gemmatimonadaceae bacterium]